MNIIYNNRKTHKRNSKYSKSKSIKYKKYKKSSLYKIYKNKSIRKLTQCMKGGSGSEVVKYNKLVLEQVCYFEFKFLAGRTPVIIYKTQGTDPIEYYIFHPENLDKIIKIVNINIIITSINEICILFPSKKTKDTLTQDTLKQDNWKIDTLTNDDWMQIYKNFIGDRDNKLKFEPKNIYTQSEDKITYSMFGRKKTVIKEFTLEN